MIALDLIYIIIYIVYFLDIQLIIIICVLLKNFLRKVVNSALH